eukprot:g12252.t1
MQAGQTYIQRVTASGDPNYRPYGEPGNSNYGSGKLEQKIWGVLRAGEMLEATMSNNSPAGNLRPSTRPVMRTPLRGTVAAPRRPLPTPCGTEAVACFGRPNIPASRLAMRGLRGAPYLPTTTRVNEGDVGATTGSVDAKPSCDCPRVEDGGNSVGEPMLRVFCRYLRGRLHRATLFIGRWLKPCRIGTTTVGAGTKRKRGDDTVTVDEQSESGGGRRLIPVSAIT